MKTLVLALLLFLAGCNMNDEVFNEPIATGWLRTELRGDADTAKGYVRDARKLLGTMRTVFGVNDRIANGEAGGFYRQVQQLPDGGAMEAITNNGQDTIRITTRSTQQQSNEETTLTAQSSKSTATSESHSFVATHQDTPTSIPTLVRKTEEEEGEEIVYDEPLVQYTLWIAFIGAGSTFELKQWNFEGGFAGPSITVSSSAQALVIFDGWLWGIDGSANIFRQSLDTGDAETLDTLTGDAGYEGASSTVTPLGVLFATGLESASYTLIGTDGKVVYSVPNNSRVDSGWLGTYKTSFINDGTHAYLHYTDSAGAPRGMTIIDVATGASTTVNLSAQFDDTPDDYRMGVGAWAAIVGDTMYGVSNRSNADDSEPTEVFMRNPSTNITSSTLADVSSYFTSGPYTNIFYGAAAITDDDIVVATTEKTITVVDPSKNTVSSTYSVGDVFGFVHDDFNGNYPILNKGTSLIPENGVVALHFLAGASNVPHLVTLDPATGKGADYSDGFAGSFGYLVEYVITPAVNPDPSLPAPKEEWEYLAPTNVNPV